MFQSMSPEATMTMTVPILVATITIIPTTLAAWWAKKANSNSKAAMSNSAGALHEVKANGGMSDPDPTLKDYIKYVGENVEQQSRRLNHLESAFSAHLAHSKIMDSALAQMFVKINPEMDERDVEDLIR